MPEAVEASNGEGQERSSQLRQEIDRANEIYPNISDEGSASPLVERRLTVIDPETEDTTIINIQKRSLEQVQKEVADVKEELSPQKIDLDAALKFASEPDLTISFF